MKPVILVLEGPLYDFNKKFLIGVFMHRFNIIMFGDMKRQISERIRAGLQNHLQFNILRP